MPVPLAVVAVSFSALRFQLAISNSYNNISYAFPFSTRTQIGYLCDEYFNCLCISVSVSVTLCVCVSVECECVLGLMHADFIWLPDKPNEIRVQSADDCYFCCKANKI